MKIYTKTGDKGKTSLLGGARVAKYDLRIEAYGTVDELNASLGVLRSGEMDAESQEVLISIQSMLFTAGSQLATEPGKTKVKIPMLKDEAVTFLEDQIDKMEEGLPPMRNFVLPGGHPSVAAAHVARTICRRAERIVLHLKDDSEVPDPIPVFLNRLSDFLFVLSRKLSKAFGAKEMPWIPEKD